MEMEMEMQMQNDGEQASFVCLILRDTSETHGRLKTSANEGERTSESQGIPKLIDG